MDAMALRLAETPVEGELSQNPALAEGWAGVAWAR
jgi:hypothetical protein